MRHLRLSRGLRGARSRISVRRGLRGTRSRIRAHRRATVITAVVTVLGLFTAGSAVAAFGGFGQSAKGTSGSAHGGHRTASQTLSAASDAAPARPGSARVAPKHSASPAASPSPSPSAASTSPPAAPSVAPLSTMHEADLIVRSHKPLSQHVVSMVEHWHKVRAAELADAGKIHVGKAHGEAIGVDASTFRPFTPKRTARSDKLWASVARGELTVSFDMGKNAKLPLGHTVSAGANHRVPIRLGAFATVGIAGVDAIVSDHEARAMGLPHGNALVLSAPKADPSSLRDALAHATPHGVHVGLLRKVVTVRDAGEFLSRTKLSKVLHAAAGRLGKPYVWGATGPNAFDCSGLMKWSYAQAGIHLPRVAAQQFFAGAHVPLSKARPGDLIFYREDPTNPRYIDHVTMYVGHGKMIAAPHTGTVVQVQPVRTARLAGVVRVDPHTASQVGW